MASHRGRLRTRAADAAARSKARLAAACRPERRTGFRARAMAGPTLTRARREVRVWGRLARTRTSIPRRPAVEATRAMSSAEIPSEATNMHSAACSRIRRSSSSTPPRTGRGLAGIVALGGADLADGQEPRGPARPGSPPAAPPADGGADDQGPQGQAPVQPQPPLVGPPPAPREQLQQQRPAPRSARPRPGRRRTWTSSWPSPAGRSRRWRRRSGGGTPRARTGAGGRTGRRPGRRPPRGWGERP